MEENKQENIPQTEKQEPQIIRPEIIGELRKEKIGKPLMVIELFLLFGIVFAGLPFINSQLNDENSKLYSIIHNKGGVVATTTTKAINDSEYADGANNNIISSSLKMKYKSIILSDIVMTSEGINCKIASYNGVTNLDDKDYFLEISASSGSKIAAFKLTGTIDNVERDVLLKSFGFSFNSTLSYQARIVEMTDDDYPDVKIVSYEPDASGYASFICSKDGRKITYKFKNNYLVRITDEDNVLASQYNGDEYINLLSAARKKANNLGSSIASVEEVNDGFAYIANINLESDYKIPDSVADNNYYPSDTLAKKIAYSQASKGYDCQ